VNTSSTTHGMMTLDSINFGAAVERSLTTMNVEDFSIHSAVESRPELITQLVCQQNTWGNHNDGLRGLSSKQTALSVLDHHKGLAAACRHDHLTVSVVLKSSKSTLLVRTKGEHRASC